MSIKRCLSAASASVLLFAAQSAMAYEDNENTVARVAETNGLTKDGWFGLIAMTPGIMRVDKSDRGAANVLLAIQHYDRLLELSPDPETRAESMRRTAYLRVNLADESGNIDAPELQKAISIYNQLLQEVPNDPANDLALYQMARAYQLVNDNDKSIAALQQLSRRYPNSALINDSTFRLAELLFARQRYDEAEPQYAAVLRGGEATPFFEPAQYKFGWTLYKQGKYEQALPVFLAIMERELPRGQLEDPEKAIASVKKNKQELTQDSLRVVGLSFASLGGGKAMNDYFARSGDPRYATLLYNSLGAALLSKQRYTDAAGVYAAFVERHPQHALGPQYQMKVIEAYQQGGFSDQVVKAKEDYVRYFAPGSNHWNGRPAPDDVVAEVRKDVEELGRHFQAKAQRTPEADSAGRAAAYSSAAQWYQRTLELFPQDAKAPEISLSLADTYYESGKLSQAAEQYTKTAYSYPSYAKAPEAAYAAVQAYGKLAEAAPEAEKAATLRQSIAASLKLADAFPQHPQAIVALTRAAQDAYAIKDGDQAVKLADRVLKSNPPAPPELRAKVLGVVADSRFEQQKYDEAEAAYTELLGSTAAGSPERQIVVEQLAASIYKQGEALRAKGDLKGAAGAFSRIARVVPDAPIRMSADYDAASALYDAQDWKNAQLTLEAFVSNYPQDKLAGDADKKLAIAYEKDAKPAAAAAAYTRIANRQTETVEVRREAAWAAAQIYDKTKSPNAMQAYEFYLSNFPQPEDRATEARLKLTEFYSASGVDPAKRVYWLQQIIAADNPAAGDAAHQAAAQANLELGRIEAGNARLLPLTQPLPQSLARRKAGMDKAIALLDRSAAYGFAEVTTQATYEIGNLYREFSRALMNSQRPANLSGEALEQYGLLLEEQADPFDQKAIEAHEANIKRVKQGVWNDAVRKSAAALMEIAPAKYAKREQRDSSYDALR